MSLVSVVSRKYDYEELEKDPFLLSGLEDRYQLLFRKIDKILVSQN